jgi:hypothetical protein
MMAQTKLAAKGVAFAPPTLSVGGLDFANPWNHGFAVVYQTLLKNLHGPNAFFKTRFSYPSPVFRGVYLWDTAFISQVWKPWDTVTAMEVNQAVWDHAAADGRLPHFVSAYARSEYTQPALMAWSVWENYLWSGDQDHLAAAYPALKAYNEWLYAHRRLPNGLFFWVHPYESGIDNSPRFSSADESEVVDMASLVAVDLCSYMVRQNETLASMAEVLGRDGDRKRFLAQAREIKRLMNDLLWDPETGFYYDLDTASCQLVKIRTIASLFPLFAGVPDPGRGRIIRDHIMEPAQFNTPFPLPSVARDEPAFAKDCWRGPVWINTAYLVILGLERYGFHPEAAELSWKLVDGVFQAFARTGKLVEFYDPDRFDFQELNRKKGNLYKLLTLGNKPQPDFVGWTGLVNTIIIEHLVGFRKVPGRRWLAPRFPAGAAGATFCLTLPAEDLSITLMVMTGGGVKGHVITPEGRRDFELQAGEEWELP